MYIPGYQIEHELGQGGMAVVYLALQESLGRHVALKVIKPNLTNDPEFAHRFLREGRIIAQLNHTNIVTVYDIGSHENTYYLSMEYLPGGTLQQRIHATFSLPEALITIRAIASALHYAHHRNIIHRDIKPQNILFRENGSPVLTDFGIAKTLGSSTLVTHTGLSIGTPRYMSPEQIRGQAVDARSDLYSLGVLFYEMLTHQVPYNAEDSFALAMMHVTSPIPELPSHLAHLQPLLNKLMDKEPAQRFQSGQEVIAALDVLENSMLSGLQETVILENTQITPPRHGWKVGVPLAMALTGAAIGGGYLFLNRTEPPTTTPATPVTTSPSAPTSQPPLVDPTVQKRTEMDRLLSQAIQQQQGGDLIASRDTIAQGLRLDPDDPPLLTLREQINQQLAAQDQARREHEQQQQQQLQNQQQVDRLLQQAQRRRQEGALEASLAQIEQGLQLMPRHAVLLDLKRDVLEQRAKRQRDLENAARQAEAAEQQRIEAEQRQRAIAEQQKLDAERRKAAAEQRKIDAERQKAATELQRLKAEEFLEQALDYQRDHAYEVSLLQIEQGLQQVPHHPQLLALRDEVRRQFRTAKSEAVPAPTPPATPSEDNDDKLAALLHKCDVHFNARRLASGKGGNATDCYRTVLRLDSSNTEALAGLDRIAEHYADQAVAMLAQDNFKATRGALDKLTQLNAAHPRLADLHKRLETAEATAKAAEIAAKEAATKAKAAAAEKIPSLTSTATAPVDASTTVLERQPIRTHPAKRAEPPPPSETLTPTAIGPIDLISLPKVTDKKPTTNSSTDEKPLATASNPASPKPITAIPDRQSRMAKIETDQYQSPVVPEPAAANTVPTESTAARDWAAIKNSTDPEDIKQFIATYPQSRQATLARNQLKQLQKQQALLPARLSIDADVEDAQVTVNGRRLGTTPLEVELKPGSYKVRVSQEGYPDWSEQIQLDANANRLLTAVLSKSSVSASEPIAHVTERRPPKTAPEPKPVNAKPTKPTDEPEPAADTTTATQTAKVSTGLNCVQGNCRNGEGIYRHADGSEYSGGFRNAKMHGQGTYIYAKRGEKYVGEWQNGVVDGQGVYYYNSGNRYEGEWRNGHKHGQGAYFYASGEKYVGEFQNDQPDGQGTYYYKNGDRYEGEWRDGQKHGQGIMYENDKKIIGEWENDRKVRVSVEK